LNSTIQLRDIKLNDLAIFYEQQLDPEANYMAAFTAKDPEDRAAFLAHWAKIFGDKSIILRTIMADQMVAGHISCHRWFGEPEISYWIGKDYWGRGIATEALSKFLEQVPARPLLARVAKDNMGSIRVLEKCGFKRTGEDKGFANARGCEVEEFIYMLG
jgi:RimJ/RimL family protein N-acetyltransferase